MRILPHLALATAYFTAAAAFAQPARIEGEVRRIDTSADKVTIRHAPIADWDMPSMTMVFRVADRGMLQRVKVGDRVRFLAERGGGAMTITEIEKMP